MQKKEQNARDEASATISAVKKEYQQKQDELQSSIDAANAREQQAKAQMDEVYARIDALAESKVSSTKNRLEREYEKKAEKQKNSHEHRMRMLESEYKAKTACLNVLTYGGVVYSVIATVFTALNSTRCTRDIRAVCKFIGNFFSVLWKNAYMLASAAWSLNDNIPYSVIDVIVPGLLAIIGFLATFGGILVLIGLGLYKGGKIYLHNWADSMSVLVTLSSLALLVWFSEDLFFIKWNLIVVFIIINTIYVLIRAKLTVANRY